MQRRGDRKPTGSRPSGYRNVYWCGRTAEGVDLWHAKVKVGQKLRTLRGSRSVDPRDCARRVAQWYAEMFGADWQTLARSNARRRNPWRVWYSKRYGGYIVWVWIQGHPVELHPLDSSNRLRPGARPLVFATVEEAKSQIWSWVDQLYPGRAREVVYITSVV